MPTQPQLSSLGNVDGRLRATCKGKHQVSLLDIEVVVDQMAPSDLLYQWFWDCRFCLSLNIMKAFYQYDNAPKFITRVRDILAQEVAVKMDC